MPGAPGRPGTGEFGCRPFAPCDTAARRTQLLFTLMPLFDAGLIVPDSRASRFTNYVPSGSPIFDPRLTLLVQGGISRRFDDDHDLALLGNFQVSGGWLDFRQIAEPSKNAIGYGFDVTAGLSLQARWGR
jgi:hypothetical protein